ASVVSTYLLPYHSVPLVLPALPSLLLLLRTRLLRRRILDAELLKIILVLRRVVVVLPHLGPEFLHALLVQPDRGLIFGANEGDVLPVLRLHVGEVVPRLRDELRTREQIEHRQRDDLRAVLNSFVRDRCR